MVSQGGTISSHRIFFSSAALKPDSKTCLLAASSRWSTSGPGFLLIVSIGICCGMLVIFHNAGSHICRAGCKGLGAGWSPWVWNVMAYQERIRACVASICFADAGPRLLHFKVRQKPWMHDLLARFSGLTPAEGGESGASTCLLVPSSSDRRIPAWRMGWAPW